MSDKTKIPVCQGTTPKNIIHQGPPPYCLYVREITAWKMHVENKAIWILVYKEWFPFGEVILSIERFFSRIKNKNESHYCILCFVKNGESYTKEYKNKTDESECTLSSGIQCMPKSKYKLCILLDNCSLEEVADLLTIFMLTLITHKLNSFIWLI
jgi:hypothetical protein